MGFGALLLALLLSNAIPAVFVRFVIRMIGWVLIGLIIYGYILEHPFHQ